jgi:hypothetical protein
LPEYRHTGFNNGSRAAIARIFIKMLKIAEALLDRLGMVLNISKPSLQN